MKPRKIVIIGQWIVPMLSPRSQRTWSLALQLAKMGHDVTVYALLGKTNYSEYGSKYNLKIKNLGKSIFGNSNSDGKPMKIITRIISKFLGYSCHFPQIELMAMTKRCISQLDDIDLLITIAFPHTIHWGAAQSFSKTRIRHWIADCGDPFMGNPFLHPSQKFESYERNWCSKVDIISVPTEGASDAYYEEFRQKIRIIPQGFDFSNIKKAEYVPHVVPTFAFSGQIYPGVRDLNGFMKYLSTLNIDFRFIVFTKRQDHFYPLSQKLGHKIEFRDYIPRDELITELSKMDFLVNVKNVGTVQQPSKLIDYAQAGRPVLNISTNFVEQEYLDLFLKGDYTYALVTKDVERYNIEVVAKQFLDAVSL